MRYTSTDSDGVAVQSGNGGGSLIMGKYFPELDGVRAVAITLVLFYHCRLIVWPQTLPQRFFYKTVEAGWVGVDLFFVLSGFLITGILLDTVGSEGYFRHFYIRRVLRIFPLYYATLTLAAFGIHVLGLSGLAQPSLLTEVAYWFYFQKWLPIHELSPHFRHFWSLAVEEQFYLLWPGLILVAARRGFILQLCVGCIVAAALVRTWLALIGYDNYAYFFTFARIDILALGAYLAYVLRGSGSGASLRWLARIIIIGAGILVAAVVLYTRGFHERNHLVLAVGLLPLGVIFVAFVAVALTAGEDTLLRAMLRSRPLRELGKVSYGVYVFHFPIIVLLQNHLLKDYLPGREDSFWTRYFALLSLGTLASVALAFISFRFFEGPILRLKDCVAPLTNRRAEGVGSRLETSVEPQWTEHTGSMDQPR